MSELGPPGLLEQVRTTTDGLQRPLEAGAFVTRIARHAAQRASHASAQQAKIQNLLMHEIHRPSDCDCLCMREALLYMYIEVAADTATGGASCKQTAAESKRDQRKPATTHGPV